MLTRFVKQQLFLQLNRFAVVNIIVPQLLSEKKMLFNKNIELFNIQSNIINPKYYDNENLFIEEINKIWYKIYFQNE